MTLEFIHLYIHSFIYHEMHTLRFFPMWFCFDVGNPIWHATSYPWWSCRIPCRLEGSIWVEWRDAQHSLSITHEWNGGMCNTVCPSHMVIPKKGPCRIHGPKAARTPTRGRSSESRYQPPIIISIYWLYHLYVACEQFDALCDPARPGRGQLNSLSDPHVAMLAAWLGH